MEERRPLNDEEFKAQQERTRQRRAELAPELSRVASLGKNVYHQLRPFAQHVSTVDRDFPLRHQQVHGLSLLGGIGGVVSDYLMIAFGNHHDLTLYQDYDPDRSPWHFTRSALVGSTSLRTEETKIYQVAPRYQHLVGEFDIEASLYKYRERIGLNPQHDRFMWNYFNDYDKAEAYIAAVEEDLNKALTDLL